MMFAPHYITSDLHFGHENILTYCPARKTWPGVSDIGSHDQHLENLWNERVTEPEEWTLVLGDFTLGPATITREIRRRLNGKIILVRGNHDRGPVACRDAGFEENCTGTEFKFDGLNVCCRHSPASFTALDVACYDVLLHGHCHGNPMRETLSDAVRDKAMDVGIDTWPTPRPHTTAETIARWRATRS